MFIQSSDAIELIVLFFIEKMSVVIEVIHLFELLLMSIRLLQQIPSL